MARTTLIRYFRTPCPQPEFRLQCRVPNLLFLALLPAVLTLSGCRPTPAPVINVPYFAALPPSGPFLVYRPASMMQVGLTGATATPPAPRSSDLTVVGADGQPAAQWRLPDDGFVPRLADAFSPDGRWLAFVSGDTPDKYLTAPITTPLKLHVWDMTTGREAFSQPLLHDGLRDELRHRSEAVVLRQSYEYASTNLWEDMASVVQGTTTPQELLQKAAEEPRHRAEERRERAEAVTGTFLGRLGQVQWSPDSRHLALIGAPDRAAADVYILDVDGWSARRLSEADGVDEAFADAGRLSWSPDSRWVLWDASADYSPGFMWDFSWTTGAASVDGTPSPNVRSGTKWGEYFWLYGWLDDHIAIGGHPYVSCDTCRIVQVDVSTGVERQVVEPLYHEAMELDPTTKLAAFSGHPKNAEGLYERDGVLLADLSVTGSISPTRFTDGLCGLAPWGADGLPFVWLPREGVEGCIATAFGPGGRTMPIGSTRNMDKASVSPHGTWRVLYGAEGWRLYDKSNQLRRSLAASATGAIDAVTWRPDDGALVWLADQQLWIADLPDDAPRLIGPWQGVELPYRPGEWDFDVAWLNPATNP
jgi:hypothetical protein